MSNPKGRKLPDRLRKLVWKRYFGPDTTQGTCFVCGETITLDAFEAGHFISRDQGGGDDLDNVRPLCRACNGSMETESIPDFKRTYFPKVLDLEPWDPVKNPGQSALLQDIHTTVQDIQAQMSSSQAQISQYPDGISDLPKHDPIQRLVDQAQALMKEARWAEAARTIEDALRLPTVPTQRAALYSLRGEVYYRRGDLADARASWEAVLQEAKLIPDDKR